MIYCQVNFVSYMDRSQGVHLWCLGSLSYKELLKRRRIKGQDLVEWLTLFSGEPWRNLVLKLWQSCWQAPLSWTRSHPTTKMREWPLFRYSFNFSTKASLLQSGFPAYRWEGGSGTKPKAAGTKCKWSLKSCIKKVHEEHILHCHVCVCV